MKRTFWRLGSALALASTVCYAPPPAWAQDAKDPDAAMKEINTWYTGEIAKAREAKSNNFSELMKERTERAKTAAKGFDADKIEPAKGLALAQLYQAAQDYPHVVAAARQFLSSKPENPQKYTAQSLLLTGYVELKDANAIIRTVKDATPPNGQMTANLAYMVAVRYAPVVAEVKGPKAALDLIDRTEKRVPFETLLKTPDVTRDDGRGRISTAQAPERMWGEMAIVQIAQARAGLLEKQGKKHESLSALTIAIEKLPPDSRNRKQLESKIRLAKLVGSPAPEVVQERGYGDFKGLDSLKGKVVVLEFTAHW